jgi:hypothetical protein
MNELKSMMEIIDSNSNVISEGDYLKLCANIKSLYKMKEGGTTFFDYNEGVVSNVSSVYFELEFIDRAKDLDYDYLQYQMEYLIREQQKSLPIQRASKIIKDVVVRHYCECYGIELDDYTPEYLERCMVENNLLGHTSFRSFFKGLCNSYLVMENEFRKKYYDSLDKRIQYIRECSYDI